MKTYLVPFLRFYNDLALRLGHTVTHSNVKSVTKIIAMH